MNCTLKDELLDLDDVLLALELFRDGICVFTGICSLSDSWRDIVMVIVSFVPLMANVSVKEPVREGRDISMCFKSLTLRRITHIKS